MVKRGVVLEYIVGGGLSHIESCSIGSSFRQEGWAMLSCLVADWQRSRTDGEEWEVIAPVDRRISDWFGELPAAIFQPIEEQQDFLDVWCHLAADCDAVILIAPESDNELARLNAAIDEVSDARLGCRSPFLERASDKLMMAEYMSDENIHPQTLSVGKFCSLMRSNVNQQQRQWILKPCDGAGCDGIWKGSGADILSLVADQQKTKRSLVQRYLPGRPASVAAWVTEKDRMWLPPVWQDIRWELDETFPLTGLERPTYRGGSGPMPKQCWATVHAFANRVLDLMGPGALGWVGIDFVFCDTDNAIQCSVIEVNPRWTTSYIGLRQIYQGNLLELLLRMTFGGRSEVGSELKKTWTENVVQWTV